MTMRRDVFLCHTSEDKPGVVRPLAKALREDGITYWYDEAEIQWGDSITEKVNEGLHLSRFVLVVLSEAFISKRWPQRELNSVLNIEASTGQVVVLPLLVGTQEQCQTIKDTYPILNDKAFVNWEVGVPAILTALRSRLSKELTPQTELSKTPPAPVAVPNIPAQVTQRDKDRFLRDAFGEILKYFKAGSLQISDSHPDVEIEVEEIHKYKFVCSIYRHGTVVNRCKIWLGGLGSSDSIAYSAGTTIDINNDNSMNDWLSIDDRRSELSIRKSNMGFEAVHGDFEGLLSPQKAAEYLWLKTTGPLQYS